MKKTVFTVGARGSALSLAQTAGALDFLRARFPGTDYRVVTVETPGDRDLVTPIEKSAPDFFTRDLDDAVRDGRIDFAVHSAKDLPPRIADDLDHPVVLRTYGGFFESAVLPVKIDLPRAARKEAAQTAVLPIRRKRREEVQRDMALHEALRDARGRAEGPVDLEDAAAV